MDASNKLETPKREAWLRIGRFALPIFLGMVVLLGLGIYLLTREDPLKTAYEKIEKGMSTQEALQIVGRPEDLIIATTPEFQNVVFVMPQQHVWLNENFELEILTKDDRVVLKELYTVGEPFFDRLRGWLGL
jgi:hypothetical protein